EGGSSVERAGQNRPVFRFRGADARRETDGGEDVSESQHEKHRKDRKQGVLDRSAEKGRRDNRRIRRARTAGKHPAGALGGGAPGTRQRGGQDSAERSDAERAADRAEEGHQAGGDAALPLRDDVLDRENLRERHRTESCADDGARSADPGHRRVGGSGGEKT